MKIILTIQAVLATLKLVGATTLSWWVVLAPVGVCLALLVALFIFLAVQPLNMNR
jgi:hypothetical protein